MASIKPSRSLVTVLGLLCALHLCPWFLGAPLQASHRNPKILNPKEYTSPSGVFRLHVNPSERHGKGWGTYRLTRDGVEVWSGQRSFTLWQAVVTDEGQVGGYSYSHGPEAVVEVGDFRVVIFDSKGVVRLQEIFPRKPSPYFHGTPTPLADGLIHDAAKDRMIVRVAEPLSHETEGRWPTYQLSTAKRTGAFDPESMKKREGPSCSFLDARPVPGTSLMLWHWWTYSQSDSIPERGARFALIDEKGNTVWEHNLPSDYLEAGDEDATEKIRREIDRDGAIIDSFRKNQFCLRFVAANQKVTFEVRHREDQSWTVAEVERQPFERSQSAARSLPKFPQLFPSTLEPIELIDQRRRSANPIRDVIEFALDGSGRIAFLRLEAGHESPTFVVITDQGHLLWSLDLEGLGIRTGDQRNQMAWVGGSRFLLTSSRYGDQAGARAWWIDVTQRQVKAVPRFDCPAIKGLAGFRDGRFLVLPGHGSSVHLFGADGKRQRIFSERSDPTPGAVFSPMGVAFTSEGKIVIGHHVKNTVTVFAADGALLETIDLSQVWGHKPNYLSTLANDVSGGYLVVDFHGHSSIVRMKSDGSVRQELTAKYPDGRSSPILQRCQVAADGRLWATDGQAIVRLNDSGHVDRVLGNKPDADNLQEVREIALNSKGQILAVDGQSASVHVFDSEGKRVRVHQSLPTDFEMGYHSFELTGMANGAVYLGASDRPDARFLHFSPEGKRLEFDHLFWWRLKADSIYPKLYPRPGLGRWVTDSQQMGMLHASGIVERYIDRDAQGNWFHRLHDGAVAPDGSLAILCDADSREQLGYNLLVYDSSGKPVRMFDLPFLANSYAPMAFDGERIALLCDKRIVLLSVTGQPLGMFTPDLGGKHRGPIVPFLPPQKKQLWVHDGAGAMLRYALPQ